jgi:hypothetical protein
MPHLLIALITEVSQPSVWRTVLDTGAPYIVSVGAGWIGSSLRLGRKIRRMQSANSEQTEKLEATFTKALNKLSEDIGTELRTMREDIDERLEQDATRLNEVAQELWGAQRNNGIRGDIRKLKEDSETQGRLLVQISTTVEMLARRASP